MSTPAVSDPILDALDAIVDALLAAGVAATRDPGEFQPPGVIVGAPTILDATLGGVLELSVPIYCVTPDPGAGGLDQLVALYRDVRDAFGAVGSSPTIWTSPLNPAGLPAFLIPLTVTATATI